MENKSEPDQTTNGRLIDPISVARIKLLSVMWLFPGLFVAMVVSNQPWILGPLKIGQYISLVNYLAVAVIVFTTFHHKLWPLFILMCIALAGGLSSFFQGMGIVFDILLDVYFCVAGAIIITQYSSLIYKQVMVICLLNVLFMIVQVTGISTWVNFLSTATEVIHEPECTLFLQLENMKEFNVNSYRPVGLTYANVIVSFMALIGLALHLPSNSRKFRWGTLMLCTMVVLSMAKIVFLGFTLISLLLVISGKHRQRFGILRAIAITILLVLLYSILFPGLFAITTSEQVIAESIFWRINNIKEALPEGSFWHTIFPQNLQVVPEFMQSSVLSGYYYLALIFPYLIVLLPWMVFIFIFGYLKQRIRYPHLLSQTMSLLIVVVIYPAAIPFWSAKIYWFIAGMALLPLFILLQPDYFQGVLGLKSNSV